MPGVCVSLRLIACCVAVNVVPSLTVVADTEKDPVYWPPTNVWDGDAVTVRAASARPPPRSGRARGAGAQGTGQRDVTVNGSHPDLLTGTVAIR